jgi:hypothetical protein
MRVPRWLPWACAGALVAAAMAKHPTLYDDSQGYIDGGVFRTAVIPLIFRVLRAVSPSSAALRLFDGLQAGLAITSCSLLASRLKERLRLDRLTGALTWLMLGLPQLQAVTTIGSESIAYSLLSISFAFAIPLVWGERSLRSLVGMAGAAALLVLTRPQFVFLVPAVALAFAGYVLTEPTWKGRWRMLAAGVGVAVVALTLQAIHTYPRLGRIGGPSIMGVIVLTVTTQVATEADEAAIVDDDARAFASRIWRESSDASDLAAQGGATPPALYGGLRYNNVVRRIEARYLEAHAPGGVEPADEREKAKLWVGMNDICVRAAKSLARRELPRLVKIDVSAILLWERYFAFIVGWLVVLSVGRARRSAEARLTLLVALGWAINVLFVSALQPPMLRYTFYFDTYVAALLVAWASRALAAADSRG